MSPSALLIAIEVLTPLRLRRVQRWEDRDFGAALGWFPVVGLLIGGVLLLLDRILAPLLPPMPTAALLLAALALLTGGLHLDGLADTADGLAVQGDRATRLGVMSEGNIGPAGVMALALVLLVQWSALVSLEPSLRASGLLIAPSLARWSATPVAMLFRPARPRGIGHALQQGVWPFAAPFSTALMVVIAVALFGVAGLALPLIAAVSALAIAGATSRMLDGVTGDTFGASIEVAQAAVLIALVIAGGRGWLLPMFFA